MLSIASLPQSGAAAGLAPRTTAPTQVRLHGHYDDRSIMRLLCGWPHYWRTCNLQGGGGSPELWGEGVGGRRTPSLLGPAWPLVAWLGQRPSPGPLAVLLRQAMRAHSSYGELCFFFCIPSSHEAGADVPAILLDRLDFSLYFSVCSSEQAALDE
jgi:hypothetical protein